MSFLKPYFIMSFLKPLKFSNGKLVRTVGQLKEVFASNLKEII